jgi:small subunit ribosomal protein S9
VAGDDTPQDDRTPETPDEATEAARTEPAEDDPGTMAGAAPEVAPAEADVTFTSETTSDAAADPNPPGPEADAERMTADADADATADRATAEPAAEAEADAGADTGDTADDEPATPRQRPEIPGADLEVDIVLEGQDPFGNVPPFGEGDAEIPGTSSAEEGDEEIADQPIAEAAIDLAANARYRATGKRKTAIARVTLRPGTGAYTINGKPLDDYFPRPALQRNIRQPLETVGYEDRMDVVARMEGGGVSSQAGALRHGISRALLEADPNLRGELKRRGFLTRDARAKERKKAGLKKARKRPQFSKR